MSIRDIPDPTINLDRDEARIRLLEMSVALADILPIYEKHHREFCKSAFGSDLAEIMPAMFLDIARLCMKDPEGALGYVKWIKEAAQYTLGETNEFPAMSSSAMIDMKDTVQKQISGLSKDMRDIYAKRA